MNYVKDLNNSMDEICKIKRNIIEIDTKINVYFYIYSYQKSKDLSKKLEVCNDLDKKIELSVCFIKWNLYKETKTDFASLLQEYNSIPSCEMSQMKIEGYKRELINLEEIRNEYVKHIEQYGENIDSKILELSNKIIETTSGV